MIHAISAFKRALTLLIITILTLSFLSSFETIANSNSDWDIAIETPYSSPIQFISYGKNGASKGVVHVYPLVIQSNKSASERLSLGDNVSFTIDYSQTPSGTTLYTWGGFNGCKSISWDGQSPTLPRSYSEGDLIRSVSNSGSFSCTQKGSEINFAATNIDDLSNSTPSKTYNGQSITQNSYIAGTYAVAFWTPISSINPSGSTSSISINTFSSGQEYNTQNNTASFTVVEPKSGLFDQFYVPESVNTSLIHSGNGTIDTLSEYELALEVYNPTFEPLTNVIICSKIDSAIAMFTGNSFEYVSVPQNISTNSTIQYGQSNDTTNTGLLNRSCDTNDATTQPWQSTTTELMNMIRVSIPQLKSGQYIQYRVKLFLHSEYKQGDLYKEFIPQNTSIWSFGAAKFNNNWVKPSTNCLQSASFSVCDKATVKKPTVTYAPKVYTQSNSTTSTIHQNALYTVILDTTISPYATYTGRYSIKLPNIITIVEAPNATLSTQDDNQYLVFDVENISQNTIPTFSFALNDSAQNTDRLTLETILETSKYGLVKSNHASQLLLTIIDEPSQKSSSSQSSSFSSASIASSVQSSSVASSFSSSQSVAPTLTVIPSNLITNTEIEVEQTQTAPPIESQSTDTSSSSSSESSEASSFIESSSEESNTTEISEESFSIPFFEEIETNNDEQNNETASSNSEDSSLFFDISPWIIVTAALATGIGAEEFALFDLAVISLMPRKMRKNIKKGLAKITRRNKAKK